MSAEIRRYAVDRIEGKGPAAQVVLIDEVSGAVVQLAMSQLRIMVAEGAVVRVSIRDGAPEWITAVRDAAEEARLRSEVEARTRRLRRGDPGGDLDL